jgi:tight adherence protein C
MSIYLITGLSFFAVSLLVLAALRFLRRQTDPVAERMRRYVNPEWNQGTVAELRGLLTAAKEQVNPALEKVAASFGVSSQNTQKQSKRRAVLMQAGFYQENVVAVFIGAKILGGLGLFVAYWMMAMAGGRSGPQFLLLAVLMALMGYLIPDFVLRAKVRRRQDNIAGALPDALDFLVICVEAGLGLNAALLRVGQELRLRSQALSDELSLVNQELRTGIGREQALRNLSGRNGIEDLKILVGSLVLSDKLGTNLADTLRAQSESLRTRVRQRAEERAAKASIKMLFPLVFFILPALFIVMMGPGVILVINTLGPLFP